MDNGHAKAVGGGAMVVVVVVVVAAAVDSSISAIRVLSNTV